MNVLIIGNAQDANRFKLRFPNHEVLLFNKESNADSADLVVIFYTDGLTGHHAIFKSSTPVLINSSFHSLSSFFEGIVPSNAFIGGFCSLPTFFEREILELSVFREETEVKDLMTQLSTDFERVADQVGLITPRVVAMIINEAFYTVEDGTASPEDIDIAMKLGTNYPFGPFEWCEKIGITNLYRLLHMVFLQTGDERYRPCDLLKREAEINS